MTEPPESIPEHDQPVRAGAQAESAFERDLAKRFAFEALREQRRSRRWGVFFKCLIFIYLLGFLIASWPDLWKDISFQDEKITALVDMQGIIAHGTDASADTIVAGLRAAFEHANTAGVIIRINSPGGSPVQAGYINDEIYRLKEKYAHIPIYAVIEDICASGGYYVATAADEIYADKASLVGSIGVRLDGFGFVEALAKLGVERRLLTAGEHKGFLDPFLPVNQDDVAHVKRVLDEVHEQFINTVRKGRRGRLADDPALFSGLIWSGEKSLALGLVDGLGSTGFVAREVIGAKEIVDFTPRRPFLDQFARRMGVQVSQELFNLFPALR